MKSFLWNSCYFFLGFNGQNLLRKNEEINSSRQILKSLYLKTSILINFFCLFCSNVLLEILLFVISAVNILKRLIIKEKSRHRQKKLTTNDLCLPLKRWWRMCGWIWKCLVSSWELIYNFTCQFHFKGKC